MSSVQCFWLILLVHFGRSQASTRTLKIAVIYSGDDSPYWASPRNLFVNQMAAQHVREAGILPPDVEIEIHPIDTECTVEGVIFRALPYLEEVNPHVVMGPACSSEASALVSFLAHPYFFNSTIQIPFLLGEAAYTTAITDLQRILYRRVRVSERSENTAEKKFQNSLGWYRIGVIYDVGYINMISEIKDTFGNQINSLVFYSEDYTDIEMHRALQSFKDNDVKIIHVAVWSGIAHLICAAEKIGMLDPEYVWFLHSFHWSTFEATFPEHCTPEQLEFLRTTDGPITMEQYPINVEIDGQVQSDVGRSTDEFKIELQEYYAKINYSHTPTEFDEYVYDAFWAAARNAEILLDTPREQLVETFFKSLAENEFFGVSGKVGFEAAEAKYPTCKAIQLKGWDWTQDRIELAIVPVGDIVTLREVEWALGETPLDYTPREIVNYREEIMKIDLLLLIGYDSVAVLIMLIVIVILIVNTHFRNQKLIKMTSPIMNNIILVGALILMLSILTYSLDAFVVNEHEAGLICKGKVGLLLLGFTLGFGALFAKAWRVYKAFTSQTTKKVIITDLHLVVQVAVFAIVDAAIYAAWQVVWPIHAQLKNVTLKESRVGPLEVDVTQWQIFTCHSDQPYFLYALFAEKALLLLFGGFIAFETRNVHIEALNDSKSIGISIYNVGFCCAFGLIASVILENNPTVSFALLGGIQLFCTVFPLAVVFGPRLLSLARDPSGESVSVRKR